MSLPGCSTLPYSWLSQLLEGRDLELCAFAPVLASPDFARVFTPPPAGAAAAALADADADADADAGDEMGAMFAELEADLQELEAQALAAEPHLIDTAVTAARFNWQLSDRRNIALHRYHRMASYTTPGGSLRTCTPAERRVCSRLEQHGLQPRSQHPRLQPSEVAPPKPWQKPWATAARAVPSAAAAPTPAAALGDGAGDMAGDGGPLEEEEAGVEAASAALAEMRFVLGTGLRYVPPSGEPCVD